MKNQCCTDNNQITVRYDWKSEKWNSLGVNAAMQSQIIVAGSEAEFITEHYWGYTSINDGETGEYFVEHPKWEIYPVNKFTIDCDFGGLYGKKFSVLENQKPVSVFLAEGSGVSVFRKRVITNS